MKMKEMLCTLGTVELLLANRFPTTEEIKETEVFIFYFKELLPMELFLC